MTNNNVHDISVLLKIATLFGKKGEKNEILYWNVNDFV